MDKQTWNEAIFSETFGDEEYLETEMPQLIIDEREDKRIKWRKLWRKAGG